MRNKTHRFFYALASFGFLVLAWWAVTASRMIPPIILPGPNEVVFGFRQIMDGYMGIPAWKHLLSSMTVMLGGYVLAVVIGVPLGVLMAWSRTTEMIFSPLVAVLRPIPPPAWIPLAILWFGIGLGGKVFIVFIAAVVPCTVNSFLAIQEAPRGLLDAARTLGASRRCLLFEVAIPAGLPVILTGLRIALGVAWATIVAAELVVSTSGLGFLVMNGYRNLESEIILVTMVAIAAIGFLMNYGFLVLERRLAGWSVGHDE